MGGPALTVWLFQLSWLSVFIRQVHTVNKGPVCSLSQTDLNKAFSQGLVAWDEQTGGVVGEGGAGVGGGSITCR